MLHYTLLAEEKTVTVNDIQRGYKGILVSCVILVILIGIGIWWLKRNA